MIDVIFAIVVFVAGIFAAYHRGKSKQRDEHETDKQNEYIATRKRIADATRPYLSDDDVADSLRNHAKR